MNHEKCYGQRTLKPYRHFVEHNSRLGWKLPLIFTFSYKNDIFNRSLKSWREDFHLDLIFLPTEFTFRTNKPSISEPLILPLIVSDRINLLEFKDAQNIFEISHSFVFNSHGSDTSYENEWILAVQDIKTISILDCMFKSTQLNKQIKTMITYTETKRVDPSIQAFTS